MKAPITNLESARTLLGSILTGEDRKEEAREIKRGYRVNIHRLSLLLEAADRAADRVKGGETWRDALRSSFCGYRGALNRFLRRVGEEPLSVDDLR
ncbi:MAG: hypothetical protein ACF8XB_09110 [Planctomycetota bacterium JB042]